MHFSRDVEELFTVAYITHDKTGIRLHLPLTLDKVFKVTNKQKNFKFLQIIKFY